MKILEILTPKRITGNFGEAAAARLLKKKGYKILERSYVHDGHEIDIIAESKDTVVFVEVKARTVGFENPKEPRPASAVNAKKQQAIITAARGYLPFCPKDKKKRFDIIEVYVSDDGRKKRVAEIKHLENCFTKSTAYKHTAR